MQRPQFPMLVLGGLLSAGMGAYHLFLPQQFHWLEAMKPAPDSLRWALIAINTFFSFLLFFSGVLVLMVAPSRRPLPAPSVGIIAAGAAFWALNLAYQFACPMPLPESMELLRRGFQGFALLAFLLHATPLVMLARGAGRGPSGRPSP